MEYCSWDSKNHLELTQPMQNRQFNLINFKFILILKLSKLKLNQINLKIIKNKGIFTSF